MPLQHEKGKLSREEMVRIVEAGMSIVHKGTVISRVEDIPPLEQLTDDPAIIERAAQRAEENARKATEEAQGLRQRHATRTAAKATEPAKSDARSHDGGKTQTHRKDDK